MADSMRSRSRGIVFTVLALGAVATTGCIDLAGADMNGFTDRQERRFSVTGTPEVWLSTFDGPIEVCTWDRPEVLVVIERRGGSKGELEQIEITADQAGNKVTVEAKATRQQHFMAFHYSRSAHLTVSVPSSSSLNARSGDGAIDIEGVNGPLDLVTGDGSIRGELLAGALKARTGDGSIRLESVNGSLDLQTGDGSVVVSGSLAGLRAHTGDGSVKVRAESGSTATADWSITTGDGTVTLDLPSSFNAELDAQTGDGRIRVADLNLSGESQDRRRQTVRGRLGSGGGMVRVRTGDGSITIQGNTGDWR